MNLLKASWFQKEFLKFSFAPFIHFWCKCPFKRFWLVKKVVKIWIHSVGIGCWICWARYKWLASFIYYESWLPTNPASFAILKKADWRFLSKFWGESNSRIFPAARTITLELSMMVFNRWAMVKTVQSANSSRIVAWIRSEKKNWGDVHT